MKGGKNMRKKLIAAMMAGVLSAGMFSTGVFAAGTDLKGEVNTFIAASLSNAMEEIQKDFNETYPDVEILYNADSSGTLQTQIEEGARCDIFFSAADKQMDALVDEDLAKMSIYHFTQNICFFFPYVNRVFHIHKMWIMWITLCITLIYGIFQ